MPKPNGPQFSPYEEEIFNAAARRMKDPSPLGRGKPGALGPLDADLIERSKQAIDVLKEWGYDVEAPGGPSKTPRGFSINVDEPEWQVSGGPNPDGPGFSVSIVHGDRFASNEDGTYKYPRGWGEHKQDLDVEPHELPTALMDVLANADVRKKLQPPKPGRYE